MGSDTCANSSCCSEGSDRLVVACSGASNVGQVSNLAAVRMTQLGVAKMTCLAALGAKLPAYIESAKNRDLVVMDGCPVGCAKIIVDGIGRADYKYFVISEMGVDKSHRFDNLENETDLVWQEIIDNI